MAAKTQPVPGKTVLVVDDHASIRAHLRDLFLSDGFTLCAEAENGSEAIQIAKDCKPDIIILDLAMPVMTGVEAAPRLKALFPNTPIILFSMHAAYLKQSELAKLGISEIFMKGDPFDRLLERAHCILGN